MGFRKPLNWTQKWFRWTDLRGAEALHVIVHNFFGSVFKSQRPSTFYFQVTRLCALLLFWFSTSSSFSFACLFSLYKNITISNNQQYLHPTHILSVRFFLLFLSSFYVLCLRSSDLIVCTVAFYLLANFICNWCVCTTNAMCFALCAQKSP